MAGIILAVVGVAVLIVAVVALRDPRTDSSQNAGRSVGASDTDVAGTPSASTTTPKSSSTPSPTKTGSTSAPPVSLGGSGSSTSASSATDGAKSVPLVVLNNTTVSGLAATAAKRFENGGWTVTSSGNFTNDIISTCAYYDPGASGAKAAAEALEAQFPTIRRVEPKFAELPSGPVVVVLTPDYRSN